MSANCIPNSWFGVLYSILCADNATLLSARESITSVLMLCNNALKRVEDGFHANLLFNKGETHEMVFTVKGFFFKLYHIKLLDLKLDVKLTWHPHIDFVGNKLSKVFFLFCYLCVSKETLRLYPVQEKNGERFIVPLPFRIWNVVGAFNLSS